jgi:riboflavin synthase
MFTGIVEERGTVTEVRDSEGGRRLRIESGFEGLTAGQSISVDGACLTVEDVFESGFEVFLARETVSRTALGGLEADTPVNLERALPADGRFDGHVVQGHVDATASITEISRLDDDWEFAFSLPESVSQYVVEKGSIAVDGISLTVADRDDEQFSVAIIPTTYEETTLSAKSVGDPVHLEVDVIAKYTERILEGTRPSVEGG